MAPKGKGGDKGGKAAAKDDKSAGGKSGKGAQTINVRHILCAKHAKKEEALAKLNAGSKFDEVAREFSEDKARTGGSLGWKTKERYTLLLPPRTKPGRGMLMWVQSTTRILEGGFRAGAVDNKQSEVG